MHLAKAIAGAALLLGCQSLLGFEPFVRVDAEDGGVLRQDGASATSVAGRSSGHAMTSAMNAGGTTSSDDTRPSGGGTPSTTGHAGTGTANLDAAGGACPRCNGLETKLDAISCDGFGPSRCEGETAQCNPQSGTCFYLDADPTEVTMEDYLAWVATKPEWPGDRPEACAWKTADFAPDGACLGGATSDVPCVLEPPPCDAGASCLRNSPPSCVTSRLPVVCVDWCDAFAYCASRGRRLCGSVRGGPVPSSLATNPGESQWTNACSAGGQFRYGSGNDKPDFGGCSYGSTRVLYEVGTSGSCHSPSPGYLHLQDFSGNAAEWEDSCDPVNDSAPGKDDPCAVRGGSYASALPDLECEQIVKVPRHETHYQIGFRCCGL